MESELGAKTSKRCSAINQPQALQSGFLLSPRKRPRRQPQPYEFPSKDGDGVSRFVAKDLRIKRVFSRNLPDGSGSSGEQISDKEGLIIANGSCPNEDEGVGKISETPEVRNLDVCNSSGFVEQRFDGKSEELGHSTPPDAEILAVASSDGCPRSSNTYAKVDTRMYSVTRTGSVIISIKLTLISCKLSCWFSLRSLRISIINEWLKKTKLYIYSWRLICL